MVRLPVLSDPPREGEAAFAGAELLAFRCTHCGHCCTDTVVPVTAVDVLRIVRATGLRADKIVSFYAPGAFTDGGRGQAFARLDVGPRVMALAQTGGRVCKFHLADRCTVYDDRPVVCRTFPFSVERDEGGRVSRLATNGGVDCRYELDGAVDWREIQRACAREARQDRGWIQLVDAWNEGWSGGTRAEFLAFVGLGGKTRDKTR
jgi:Fe-S-cluster containining protein